MRLLLVEDERAMAAALRKGLESEGFVVEHAADGPSGLQAAPRTGSFFRKRGPPAAVQPPVRLGICAPFEQGTATHAKARIRNGRQDLCS